MNEGNTRITLAEIGVDSRENLETAISLYGAAQKIFPEKNPSYALTLMNEGSARQRLAEMGVDSRENLETTISLYETAQEIFPEKSIDYALTLMNEGSARQRLAEMGIDSRKNTETAIRLYTDAKEIFSKNSEYYALASMNEGNSRKTLAEMGIDGRKNLETAVHLYGVAKEIIPKTSTSYARVLGNEANARSRLAEMGIDSKENLETAICLYIDAREMFSKKSAEYARALLNEGNARKTLAEMGVDSRENLETAISLYADAKVAFSKKSVDYACALMDEGTARSKLAEMGIDSRENFERAKKLYLGSISTLEELGDGWTYSVALLYFNNLLKYKFYKTGEKKYLEEWQKNLGDIERKIKNQDIRYKELLVARIHEVRASLFEFDGEFGISNASLEYYKAYETSQEIFYKFMKEFCQARVIKPSIFCNLVSDWKEVEKEGIFLDYYDYAIFECHLENSLKSTVSEEDELKLAVEKLKEIRDRTHIKIIRDRVSAYIHLLQALVDYFNNDSYKKATENVKEGCKIFREYGDKQGQQMCEIFHNAVVKRKDPDAWQKIIRNREFSSNCYSLLCEYSDRKRAYLEDYRSGQLHEKMDAVSKDVEQVKEISIRTENKVDEIQTQMHSGFAEIKDQIENGFDGTAAELREIKGKINNIQQDLDYLIRISNDVSGKEGECIKEFSLQMLELMKKGDCEALKRFIERTAQNSSAIVEIIETTEIPEKEKEEAKLKLSDLKRLPGILKEKTKSFSVDVTKDVIVSLTAEQIITLLTPVLSTATFGVPIPSQILTMLLTAIRNS